MTPNKETGSNIIDLTAEREKRKPQTKKQETTQPEKNQPCNCELCQLKKSKHDLEITLTKIEQLKAQIPNFETYDGEQHQEKLKMLTKERLPRLATRIENLDINFAQEHPNFTSALIWAFKIKHAQEKNKHLAHQSLQRSRIFLRKNQDHDNSEEDS